MPHLAVDRLLSDIHFLDGVGVGYVTGFVARADWAPIDLEIVLLGRTTSHFDAIRGPGQERVGFLAASVLHRRVEIRKLERIAVKPGKLLNQLGVDRKRNIGLVERNSNRGFRYRHRVIYLADLERNVDRDVPLRLYRKVLLDSL